MKTERSLIEWVSMTLLLVAVLAVSMIHARETVNETSITVRLSDDDRKVLAEVRDAIRASKCVHRFVPDARGGTTGMCR